MQNTEHRHGLSSALRHMARADEEVAGAATAVRARLLVEVGAIRRARRQGQMKMAAIAAVLLLAVLLPIREIARRMPMTPEPVAEVTTEFFPLRYSNVPMNHGRVVRIQVPEAAMTSFGLRPSDPDPMNTVLADVLIGEDGLARAVSFVLTPQEEQQ